MLFCCQFSHYSDRLKGESVAGVQFCYLDCLTQLQVPDLHICQRVTLYHSGMCASFCLKTKCEVSMSRLECLSANMSMWAEIRNLCNICFNILLELSIWNINYIMLSAIWVCDSSLFSSAAPYRQKVCSTKATLECRAFKEFSLLLTCYWTCRIWKRFFK